MCTYGRRTLRRRSRLQWNL
ncbi:hypothetical protein BDFB_010633 [Asbolus verrucosus]|uniref:Uncharacterized protein n=1 Tax=Asbolus verrucosus TaxID=1661398 RepID=A0A482V8B8_ASBVE|nr:hypothetical protein BDFB_010633 [Asbolus verrucosus]